MADNETIHLTERRQTHTLPTFNICLQQQYGILEKVIQPVGDKAGTVNGIFTNVYFSLVDNPILIGLSTNINKQEMHYFIVALSDVIIESKPDKAHCMHVMLYGECIFKNIIFEIHKTTINQNVSY